MLSMDMKKKNLLSRGAFSILFLVISCTVSSAQKIESTTVHPVFNGLEWQKKNGKLLVQFVKSDVVRVRFQPEDKFVTIDKTSGAISYYNRQHRLLLSENPQMPRSAERVYQEKVTFDEKSRHVVHTANGDVEEMDVLRRDTLGSAYRYQMNFDWRKGEALQG